VHRKLAAAAGHRAGRAIVAGNGAEGEPASDKDKTLLREAPHLVLDGLQLAAEAVRASGTVLYVCCGQQLRDQLTAVIAERAGRGLEHAPVRLAAAPPRFLAGQESALASRISGGAAPPRFTPPQTGPRGAGGRPVLVQNVETLAQLALIARYGAAWFRGAGTPDEPGTMLCTLRQADGSAGVAEVPIGTPLAGLLDLAGAGAVLAGGYHGSWLPAGQAARLTLSNADLRPFGASVGAGVLADLRRWAGLMEGRGACHHPDATVRFVRSALRTFAAEIRRHQQGGCSATSEAAFLPVPAGPAAESDWT
jgi:NADH:ubiquinone oxidoreductase subunit F (NADH-binding)